MTPEPPAPARLSPEWGGVPYAGGSKISALAPRPLTEFERLEQRVADLEALLAANGKPVLTPETARALLSENVTVVKPGETLVIRIPDSWTPAQHNQYQEYADAATEQGRISFPVLVVIGEELGVVQAEDAPGDGTIAP